MSYGCRNAAPIIVNNPSVYDGSSEIKSGRKFESTNDVVSISPFFSTSAAVRSAASTTPSGVPGDGCYRHHWEGEKIRDDSWTLQGKLFRNVSAPRLCRRRRFFEQRRRSRINSEIPIGYVLFEEHPFNFRDDTITGVRYRNLFDMMAAPYEAAVEGLKREVKTKQVEIENLREKLKTATSFDRMSATATAKSKAKSKRRVSCTTQAQVYWKPLTVPLTVK